VDYLQRQVLPVYIIGGYSKMTAEEKALEIVNESKIGMFGNKDEHGNPQIKAMLKAKNEGLKVFWFCSNTSSKRVAQIQKDSNACLYFNEGFNGVMMSGTAEVSWDDEIRKSFWEDGMEHHYPLGALDPDYVLIKFVAKCGNLYRGLPTEDFIIG